MGEGVKTRDPEQDYYNSESYEQDKYDDHEDDDHITIYKTEQSHYKESFTIQELL